MKRKTFIFIEGILGVLVLILAFLMVNGKIGKKTYRVSVILQNSNDEQWNALKYGLKMAAKDQEIEMFVEDTEGSLTVEEEKKKIEGEIKNGVDAVIMQASYGTDTYEMLKGIQKKLPLMLIEQTPSQDETSEIPLVMPNHYQMGADLAAEVLKDYDGKISGKKIGIVSHQGQEGAAIQREQGFLDGIKGQGAQISWSVSDAFSRDQPSILEAQLKVDIMVALDDTSLTEAGASAASNNLHGALIYGIGNSTEAVYYLDTGIVRSLVIPDEFNIGYQSMTEIAQRVKRSFYKPGSHQVSHKVIRREELFTKENQEIIFSMSQ